MRENEILKIYGTDYIDMTRILLEEAGLAGQIRETIKNRDPGLADPCIGIKPNLVTPSPAMFGATTHPEIVEGIILYLQEHGFTDLMICEGSWVGDKTSEAFEYCGFNTLAEKYGVQLLDTQKDSSFTVTCPISEQAAQKTTHRTTHFPKQFLPHNSSVHEKSVKRSADADVLELHLCSCLNDIDFLINVPVLKGHCQTKMTCALKNMKGLIPNSEKRRFHSLGLHKPIAYLNSVIHQDFIVVDHICGDPDFEEGGDPLVTNCIMAALDPVLTDAYACQLLGYQADEVEYVRLAAEAGVGSNDLNMLEIRQLYGNDPNQNQKKNAPPDNDPVILTHKALQLNYATQEIDSCSACYSALTEALHRLSEEGLLHKLTDELHVTFHIGQGYRGLSSPADVPDSDPSCIPERTSDRRIGIGNCTRLFTQNIPGCPPTGDEIYQYLRCFLAASISLK